MTTTKQSIEDRVKKVIINQLDVNPEQVTAEASFLADLGADSLDTVELVMAFEEEFEEELKSINMKEIPEADSEKLQTVQQVIDYFYEKIKS